MAFVMPKSVQGDGAVFTRLPPGSRNVLSFGGDRRVFVRDRVWSDGQVTYRVVDGLTDEEVAVLSARSTESRTNA